MGRREGSLSSHQEPMLLFSMDLHPLFTHHTLCPVQPDKFPDSAAFEEEYSMQTMDGVSALHAVLRYEWKCRVEI